MRDRRRSPRQSFWLPSLTVAVQEPGHSPHHVTVNARDISCHGIALEHERSLVTGTTVYLNLPTLDAEWLPVEGRVVACRRATAHHIVSVAFAWPVDVRRVQVVAA
jgi:hypothetical protein